MNEILRSKVRRFLGLDEFHHLRTSVITLNDVGELKKVFRWQKDPIIDDPYLLEFQYVEDVNQRRLRDLESVTTVVRNINPTICVDIGTGSGSMAAMMAVNAPQAQIHTINIPPEEFSEGGHLTTMKLERNQIGAYYRRRGIKNISQIYANTATWEPNIGEINVAFIDGSHDTSFVINDTLKVLTHMKPGAFILWHDFNLSLVHNYHWIKTVCLGVESLLSDGHIKGRIFHLRDAWVGIYRVG
ncbi:MAG: class I SAM-dependent methyltransferase [Anaerolineaceae bacterium]|nr:MAG: class I SAM-dependent methyltransferase [Anaerolineaceae bacterium]